MNFQNISLNKYEFPKYFFTKIWISKIFLFENMNFPNIFYENLNLQNTSVGKCDFSNIRKYEYLNCTILLYRNMNFETEKYFCMEVWISELRNALGNSKMHNTSVQKYEFSIVRFVQTRPKFHIKIHGIHSLMVVFICDRILVTTIIYLIVLSYVSYVSTTHTYT